jgi:hypothetical protein
VQFPGANAVVDESDQERVPGIRKRSDAWEPLEAL